MDTQTETGGSTCCTSLASQG